MVVRGESPTVLYRFQPSAPLKPVPFGGYHDVFAAQLTAEHDQGDADHQPHSDQDRAAVCGGGDGDHVVQRHHRIRDQDGSNRTPRMRFRGDAWRFDFRDDELHADVQEQEAPHQLEVGNPQQRGDDQTEGDAQADRCRASAHHGHSSLRLGQRPRGESNHHGVVAGQQDVDARDPQQVDDKPGSTRRNQKLSPPGSSPKSGRAWALYPVLPRDTTCECTAQS
jgi:hypothetical protein